MIGQMFFALGCSVKSIEMMLFGRVLFGLGGEVINIAQNCIILKWFKKSELSFPCGLAITVARFGSGLNDIITPRISDYAQNPSNALWAGEGIVIGSFTLSVTLIFIDYYISKNYNTDNAVVQSKDDEINFALFSELKFIFWSLFKLLYLFYKLFYILFIFLCL